MTLDDRRRWDERWTTSPDRESPPSPWLAAHLSLLPQGRILDVAAGRGRNVPAILTRAARVVAVDVSIAGLRLLRGSGAQPVCMDLDRPGFREGAFDGIVCVNFLDRRLFDLFARWIRPGGTLFFDTFRIDQREIGHPRNPNHLLDYGELRARLDGWEILRYREGEVKENGARSFRASAIAIRPG